MPSNYSSENGPFERPDRLYEYAGLLYDVASLVTEVETDKEHSEHCEHVFTFELIGEHFIEVPSEITNLISNVDQIVVTLQKELAYEQLSIALSIDFLSNDSMITVSRSHDGETTYETDTFFDTSYHFDPDLLIEDQIGVQEGSGKEQINTEPTDTFQQRLFAVDKISLEKINTLLMSLIYPDKERGYMMFAEVNFLSADAYESLVDSFTLSAMSQSNSFGHRFNTNDAYLSYYKEGDDHVSFSLQYPDKDNLQVITARSNMNTDFSIQFTVTEMVGQDFFSFKKEPAFDMPAITPYHPTSEEIVYLRSILQTETEALNPRLVELVDEDSIDSTNPEQALLDSNREYYSRRYVQEILDQLSLDTSDPSTT